MAQDNRSFSRRTVLQASMASVGGLMAVGTASADESNNVACPSCIAAYNISEIQIDKAVPPSIVGSVTVTKPCVAAEGRVQIFVDDMFVREEVVNVSCTQRATVNFEYEPESPLKPGTYELRITVPLENENLTTEKTIEFQVPSSQGQGRGKAKANGKGR